MAKLLYAVEAEVTFTFKGQIQGTKAKGIAEIAGDLSNIDTVLRQLTQSVQADATSKFDPKHIADFAARIISVQFVGPLIEQTSLVRP